MFQAELIEPTTATPTADREHAEPRWGVSVEVEGPLHAVDRAYALNVGRRLRLLGRMPAHAADLRLVWVPDTDLPAHASVALLRGSWHFAASASGRTYREALDRLEAGVRRELVDDRSGAHRSS
jgi:hypothetical protein